jgi:hypothetical protein
MIYGEILNIVLTILSFLVLLYTLIVSGLVLAQRRRERRTAKLFKMLGKEKIRTEIGKIIEHLDMSQEDKESFVAYASSLWDRSLVDILQNERERVRLFRGLSSL